MRGIGIYTSLGGSKAPGGTLSDEMKVYDLLCVKMNF